MDAMMEEYKQDFIRCTFTDYNTCIRFYTKHDLLIRSFISLNRPDNIYDIQAICRVVFLLILQHCKLLNYTRNKKSRL